jgi:hypothetical protein
MMGFAAIPEIDVEPWWSTRKAKGPRAVRRRRASDANAVGQLGSYGTISSSSSAIKFRGLLVMDPRSNPSDCGAAHRPGARAQLNATVAARLQTSPEPLSQQLATSWIH